VHASARRCILRDPDGPLPVVPSLRKKRTGEIGSVNLDDESRRVDFAWSPRFSGISIHSKDRPLTEIRGLETVQPVCLHVRIEVLRKRVAWQDLVPVALLDREDRKDFAFRKDLTNSRVPFFDQIVPTRPSPSPIRDNAFRLWIKAWMVPAGLRDHSTTTTAVTRRIALPAAVTGVTADTWNVTGYVASGVASRRKGKSGETI